jgi:hypothetical protein
MDAQCRRKPLQNRAHSCRRKCANKSPRPCSPLPRGPANYDTILRRLLQTLVLGQLQLCLIFNNSTSPVFCINTKASLATLTRFNYR